MTEEAYARLLRQLEHRFWDQLIAYQDYVGPGEWVSRISPEDQATLYLMVGLSEGWWKPENAPRRPQILLVRG